MPLPASGSGHRFSAAWRVGLRRTSIAFSRSWFRFFLSHRHWFAIAILSAWAEAATRVSRIIQLYKMIVGLGIDISEVDRIEAAITRHGTRFLNRVFTAAEISYCEKYKNRFERYAGRFAAKEAGMKALGTGWRRGVRWVDFEVVRLSSGRPTLELHGRAHDFAARLGVSAISLSITHSANTALAQVIFES